MIVGRVVFNDPATTEFYPLSLHDALPIWRLTGGQVQAWALNRYYYQASIPAKDASLLARLPTPGLRREWRRRLVDHDGDGVHPGGVARWLRLTDGLGLDGDDVRSEEGRVGEECRSR